MSASEPHSLSLPLELAVLTTPDLPVAAKRTIVELCTRAFGRDFSSLFYFVHNARHVLASLDGRLVGHALWGTRRLQPAGMEPLRTAYLDAVATDPDLWGRGIGRAVIARMEVETAEFEIRACSTDHHGFYQKLDWQRWLGPTGARKGGAIIPTPDDIVMISLTNRTPAIDMTQLLTVEWREGSVW